MPIVEAKQFTELNLLAGTVTSLGQTPLSPDDKVIWDRDFALLVDNLSKLCDPDLGADFLKEAEFYLMACQIAKNYFDGKPLGGMTPRSGQFGFRFILPQDMSSAAAYTAAMHKWKQTVVVDASHTWDDIIGTSSSPYFATTTAQAKITFAFHKLISYQPDPKVFGIKLWVNETPYPGWSVEPFAKISKGANKNFRLLPMPGRVVIHPGGKFAIGGCFQKALAFATEENVDIEIAPLGLTFCEYDHAYSEKEGA